MTAPASQASPTPDAIAVPSPMPASLSTLAECEAIIEKGLQTFIEVGNALLTIREKRLYKENFSTFEDYCRERWGFRREVADRYVRAAEVVTAINPIGLPAPRSEAVARELAHLRSEPEKAREAWAEAVEKHGPQPTAKQVREVVRHEPEPAHLSNAAEKRAWGIYGYVTGAAALGLIPSEDRERRIGEMVAVVGAAALMHNIREARRELTRLQKDVEALDGGGDR